VGKRMKKSSKWYTRAAWRNTIITLAAVVVFATTYALILPAATLDGDTAEEDPAVHLEGEYTAAELTGERETAPGDVAVTDAETDAAETPAEGEEPADAETPAEGEEPADAETPAEGEEPADAETPAEGEEPADAETPAEGETPAPETPVEPTAPVVVSEPVEEVPAREFIGPVAMPACSFSETLDGLVVEVEAPKGAFPQGTTMQVTWVDVDDDMLASIESSVDGQVAQTKAVDITFRDADGAEVQPLVEIRVSMRDALVAEARDLEVVHVDADGNAEVVSQAEDDSADDEVIFDANHFSVYVLVEKVITEVVITDSGEVYTVNVTYGPEAGIPEGSGLQITEYDASSAEYKAAMDAVVAAKLAEDPEFDPATLGMSALDISIIAPDGTPVEPSAPVKVEIAGSALPADADAQALQSTMELQHIRKLDDGKLQAESVANTYTNYGEFGGNITVAEDSLTATFDVDGFSTFSFTWTSYGVRSNIIVHYVDVNGNEIQGPHTGDVAQTAQNNSSTWTVTFASSNYEGGITNYTFKEARLGDVTGPKVTGARFERKWMPDYTTENHEVDGHYVHNVVLLNGTTTVQEFTGPANVEVYFVYELTEVPPGGQTPGLNAPDTDKTLVRQDDGTYDITLSISGSAKVDPDKKKANVLVIYDTSGSMETTETTTDYVEDPDGDYVLVDGEYVRLTQRNGWYMNGQPYYGYRYKQSTSNSPTTQYGIRNGNVIDVYYNDGNWYRTRTQRGNWITGYYYTYSNPYNGTRYVRVNNGDSDTSYNLGWNQATGQMVELTYEEGLYYTVGGTSYKYDGETRYREVTTTKSRHEIAKAAVTSLANKLLGMNGANGNDNDMVEMALIEFDSLVHRINGANVSTPGAKTSSKDTFLKWVNGDDNTAGITIPGTDNNRRGTNWEDALDYANRYSWGDTDPVYIVFVSDGQPTFRISKNGHQDGRGNNNNSVNTSGGGRTVAIWGSGYHDDNEYNIDAAVMVAKSILASNKDLYTVGAFVDPEHSKMPNLGGADYDASNSENLNSAFNDIVYSITNALNIANVQITDGITALTASALVAGDIDPSTFRYTKGGEPWSPVADGANGAELVVDDETGAQSIQWNMGENYVLEPNVTYTVTFTVWPKQEAYDTLANLNNGLIFYDYADYLARSTDNPKKTEAEARAADLLLSDTLKAQIIKSGNTYTVKTNTEAGVTYQEVTYKNGEETGRSEEKEVPIENPTNGMGLSESTIQVQKVWNDSLDPTQLLKMLESDPNYKVRLWITLDSGDYVEVTIAPQITYDANGKVTGATWPIATAYIAPGVMLDVDSAEAKGIDVEDTDKYPHVTYNGVEYVVLESGHDYSIDEQATDYHFELSTGTYHPMVVNGETYNVTFIYKTDPDTGEILRDADGNPIVDGIEAMDTDNSGTLVATNELRAGLNMRKIVLDEAGNEIYPTEETFYYRAVLKGADGREILFSNYMLTQEQIDAIENYEAAPYLADDGTTATVDVNQDTYPIWYNIYYGAYDDLDTDGTYIPEGQQYYNRSPGMVIQNGGIVALKAGEVIRFANIPLGTHIELVEVNIPDGYEFEKYETKVGKNTSTWTTSEDVASGIVVPDAKGNTSYYFVTTNVQKGMEVELIKVDTGDSSKTLSGAEFELYKVIPAVLDEDGVTVITPESRQKIGTTWTTDSEGKLAFGTLEIGTYKLVETKAPAGYNLSDSEITIYVTADGVTYDQPDNAASNTKLTPTVRDGVKVYTITVTNSKGAVLPHTGGAGTFLYTLCGLMLMASAAAVYGFRMRRRERGTAR